MHQVELMQETELSALGRLPAALWFATAERPGSIPASNSCRGPRSTDAVGGWPDRPWSVLAPPDAIPMFRAELADAPTEVEAAPTPISVPTSRYATPSARPMGVHLCRRSLTDSDSAEMHGGVRGKGPLRAGRPCCMTMTRHGSIRQDKWGHRGIPGRILGAVSDVLFPQMVRDNL